MTIQSNIVDVIRGICGFGQCIIENGYISSLEISGAVKPDEAYLMPGFVDAHVHIESSMLVPTEFARLAVVHGTVATVSDPHEIANVLGVTGVEYMLENAKHSPFKFNFGVPSCVPATAFETAGDVIDVDAVRELLNREDLSYLAEMMNYPGVIHDDPDVLAKISAARVLGKPVDGHAPGVTGDDAIKYINAGIGTDHECVTYAEASHKLAHGMRIIIREGSAAKNFEALHTLISEHPDMVMLCSDDKHPDDLLIGHINQLAARAVSHGHRWQDVLQAACVNPVLYYGLNVGLLREGDPADMILVDNLSNFNTLATYIDGNPVCENGSVILPPCTPAIVNRFEISPIETNVLRITATGASAEVRVIEAIDGALITGELHQELEVIDGYLQARPELDVLKIVVVNRYSEAPPAVAFVSGFGLKRGAIASSVAHDSHNIVAVGVDDKSLANAINLVIHARGGVAATDGEGAEHILSLPVAGIMSDAPGVEVAKRYTEVDAFVKHQLSTGLKAPFMTLSFMALLVIPQLKLSDKGLFDGGTFRFVDVTL
jgi:adenine deaminase